MERNGGVVSITAQERASAARYLHLQGKTVIRRAVDATRDSPRLHARESGGRQVEHCVSTTRLSRIYVLRRTAQAQQVACGLEYLHTRSPAIIHGNVVAVSTSRRPRTMDLNFRSTAFSSLVRELRVSATLTSVHMSLHTTTKADPNPTVYQISVFSPHRTKVRARGKRRTAGGSVWEATCAPSAYSCGR